MPVSLLSVHVSNLSLQFFFIYVTLCVAISYVVAWDTHPIRPVTNDLFANH